jgi:hypothetical protein
MRILQTGNQILNPALPKQDPGLRLNGTVIRK